jgi:hypothetical protein
MQAFRITADLLLVKSKAELEFTNNNPESYYQVV